MAVALAAPAITGGTASIQECLLRPIGIHDCNILFGVLGGGEARDRTGSCECCM